MRNLLEILHPDRWGDLFIEAALLVGVAFAATAFVVLLALI